MKHAFVTDVHIHDFQAFRSSSSGPIGSRGMECLATYRRAVSAAAALGCQTFTVAGDLFHIACPPPVLIYEVGKIHAEFKNVLTFDVMLGNHDLNTYQTGDNACSPLGLLPNTQIIGAPCVGRSGLLCVPFQNGSPTEWLPKVMQKFPDVCGVVLHMGLATEGTPAIMMQGADCIRADDLAKICGKADVEFAFMGHWHKPDEYRAKNFHAVQISTLIPASFSDVYEGTGRMLVYDDETNTVSFENIPGPRFLAFAPKTGMSSSEPTDFANATLFAVQVSCYVEDFETICNEIRDSLVLYGLPEGVQPIFVASHRVDRPQTKAKEVSAVTYSADSVANALDRWMVEQDVEAKQRHDVAMRVAHYIATAKAAKE